MVLPIGAPPPTNPSVQTWTTDGDHRYVRWYNPDYGQYVNWGKPVGESLYGNGGVAHSAGPLNPDTMFAPTADGSQGMSVGEQYQQNPNFFSPAEQAAIAAFYGTTPGAGGASGPAWNTSTAPPPPAATAMARVATTPAASTPAASSNPFITGSTPAATPTPGPVAPTNAPTARAAQGPMRTASPFAVSGAGMGRGGALGGAMGQPRGGLRPLRPFGR